MHHCQIFSYCSVGWRKRGPYILNSPKQSQICQDNLNLQEISPIYRNSPEFPETVSSFLLQSHFLTIPYFPGQFWISKDIFEFPDTVPNLPRQSRISCDSPVFSVRVLKFWGQFLISRQSRIFQYCLKFSETVSNFRTRFMVTLLLFYWFGYWLWASY